jgi:hypothetical protein
LDRLLFSSCFARGETRQKIREQTADSVQMQNTNQLICISQLKISMMNKARPKNHHKNETKKEISFRISEFAFCENISRKVAKNNDIFPERHRKINASILDFLSSRILHLPRGMKEISFKNLLIMLLFSISQVRPARAGHQA